MLRVATYLEERWIVHSLGHYHNIEISFHWFRTAVPLTSVTAYDRSVQTSDVRRRDGSSDKLEDLKLGRSGKSIICVLTAKTILPYMFECSTGTIPMMWRLGHQKAFLCV